MKKLMVLLYAVVMAFSLTACGGSSKDELVVVPASTVTEEPVVPASTIPETPKAPQATAEPELSPYDKAKQNILEHVDVAYSGLTAAGAPMYFLASSDGQYVALVLENTDKKRYIKFVGSAVIDDDSGILTVTDDEKGYTFGFTAEKQEDGSFFLDCGNLGECYLASDDPGDVVDYIIKTFQSMEDATDEVVDSFTKQSILDNVDLAYFGVTEADGVMYFLANEDGSFAALVFENADETGYIKFIGSASMDEESGILTVTDREKGYRFGFIAEEQEDGSVFLDCGELGECYMEPDEPADVVDFIAMAFEDMEDVTDKYMATYGR